MSRIRTIKPEFFTSEDITSLTPLSRLFYASLWCECDREGRFEYKPGTLKNRYFPADKLDIEDLMDELVARRMVRLYQPDGFPVLGFVVSFKKHQVINNREGESLLPPFSDDACFTRESRVKAEGRKEGRGKEGRNKTPTEVAVTDNLLRPILDSFLSEGNFANYQKETVCAKAIIKAVRNLSPDNPEKAAELLLVTFRQLVHGTDKFWAGQPFLPSGLSPLVERVWAEAIKTHRVQDTTWLERVRNGQS